MSEPKSLKDRIAEIIENAASNNTQRPLMHPMFEKVMEMMPEELTEQDFKHYIHYFGEGRDCTLKLSLLTNEPIVYDFLVSVEKELVKCMPLNHTTSVKIETTLAESDIGRRQPHRTELEITTGSTSLHYFAEGGEYLRKHLVAYGQECLGVLRELARAYKPQPEGEE